MSGQVADTVVRLLLEVHAGCAKNGDINVRAGGYEISQDRNEDQKHDAVADASGCKQRPDFLLDPFDGIIADETPGFVDGVHDTITRVDAGCAIDAFQLCPVADVDAGWTHVYTLAAIDAVSQFAG